MLLSYSTKTLEAVEFASLTNGRLEFYCAKIILFDLRLIFMYCSGPLRRTPSSLESFYKDDLSLSLSPIYFIWYIYIYTISETSSLNSCARYCNRGHWSRDKKKKSKKASLFRVFVATSFCFLSPVFDEGNIVHILVVNM